jgi:glycosyltransferase involved in cell wall biosynthesis
MLAQFTPEIIRRHGLELVVSDGGSTDRTLAIARGATDHVVENRQGTKQTIAIGRNVGAQYATGDILVFLNADTLIQDVDTFFPAIREALDIRGVVAATCSVQVYPEEERPSDRRFHGFYNWFFAMMNRVGMGMGRGECHAMSREVFREVQGYADRIAAGEDYDLFRRLIRKGRIIFLHNVVVYESPRRYRKYGYLCVSLTWFANFLAVFFLRRSILSEWKPVR